MATPPKAPRACRIEVPGEIPGGGLADADYASAFELATPDARALTPAQWARGAFEGAPAPLRPVLLLGWTLVLGLRLGPRPSPDHVLGWPIRDAGPDSVTLEADSRLLAARNTVLVSDSSVVWVTFVRFDRPVAKAIWALAAPIHHLTVPYALRRTASRAIREKSPGR